MSLSIVLRAIPILSVFAIVSCSDGASQTDPISKPNEPPVTTITPNQTYISHERDIELSCSDSNVDDSCVKTYFSWEGENLVAGKDFEYKGAFKVGEAQQYSDDDIISVNYFSVDTNNAEEALKTKEYILDKTAPVALPGKPEGKYKQAINLTFTCTDKKQSNPSEDGSGCSEFHYYTTNDANNTPDPSPGNADFTVVPLDNATATEVILPLNSNTYVHYFAVDKAGSRQLVTTAFYEFIPDVVNVVNFTAQGGRDKVTLSWEIPAGNTAITGVQIMRSQISPPNIPTDGVEVYKGLISPQNDPLILVSGETYHYTVFAYIGNGSPYSLGTSASATPFSDNAPPSEVLDLQQTPGIKQVTISWKNPSDPDFARSVLRRSDTQDPISISDGVKIAKESGVAGATESLVDTELVNDTQYFYRVFTVDIYDNVSAGVPFTATPVDLAPGNIASLTAQAGDTLVDLIWSYPQDPDLAGVKIIRKIDSAPTAHDDSAAELIATITDTTQTSIPDTTVINGSTYYYAAYAFDKRQPTPNYSPAGALAGPVTPADVLPPGDVTAVSIKPANGKLVLAWSKPADLDLANVIILRKEGGYASSPTDTTAISVPSGTVQPLIDAGLTNGTLYYYTIYTADEVPNYSAGVQIEETPNADDIAGPTVSTTSPVDAATAVDPNTAIDVTFSEDILRTSVVDGVMTLTAQTGVDSSGAPVTRNLTGATPTMPSTTSIKVAPADGQFPLATKITASLKVAAPATPGVTDLSDNPLDPTPQTGQYDWTFTTADGGWGKDADVKDLNNYSTGNGNERKTSVAIDNKGNALAVWTGASDTSNKVIVAKSYSPLTGWETTEIPISDTATNSDFPVVKMDNNGNSLIVWLDSNFFLRAKRKVGEVWSKAALLQLDAQPQQAVSRTAPAVAINVNGVVTVAWSQCSTSCDIWTKRFDLTQSDWSALPDAELIEWLDFNARNPQVAVDELGNAIVIWEQEDANNTYNVMYNRYSISGTAPGWDQPDRSVNPPVLSNSPISDALGSASKLSLAMGADGNAIAIWTQSATNSNANVIWKSEFDVTNAIWNATAELSDGTISVQSQGGKIAMQKDGSAIVAWVAGSTELYVNKYDANSQTWLGGINLRPSSTIGIGIASITMDVQGNAMIALDGRDDVYAQRYINGKGDLLDPKFQLKIEPSLLFGNTYNISVATNDNGTSVAVWNKLYDPAGTGSSSYFVRANSFDFRPGP